MKHQPGTVIDHLLLSIQMTMPKNEVVVTEQTAIATTKSTRTQNQSESTEEETTLAGFRSQGG